MTHDEMIAVLIAQKEGKAVQSISRYFIYNGAPCVIGDWADFPSHARPDFNGSIYRVKPSPSVLWVNEYADGSGGYGYRTKQQAEKSPSQSFSRAAVKFIEVIE